MRYLFFSAFILLFGLNVFAQNQRLSDKYMAYNLTSLSLTKVIDESGFKPRKITSDATTFRSLVLQLDNQTIQQLNIDTWWLCSQKHEENFQIYNMYYKPISKVYFDANCKELIALMEIDGTVIQPK